MVELKKIETYLQQLPQKNKPPLFIRLPPEFQQLFSPQLSIFKKLDLLQFKKGGDTENEA